MAECDAESARGIAAAGLHVAAAFA